MVDLSGRMQTLPAGLPEGASEASSRMLAGSAQGVEGIAEVERRLRSYLRRGLNALAWAYCLRLLEMDSDNPAFRRYVRQIKHRLETGR